MAHQSYREVLVVNNPSLFTDGYSDDLAVGQLGIFSVDSTKDEKALASFDFTVDKIIQLIQGTPETPGNSLGAIANQPKRTKPIKGKRILSWSGAKPGRGQNQIVALGYDGFDTTKTLTARCEETRMVFIKLTGSPIDQAFHTEGKGYVRQYSVYSGCCDDCGDDCATVASEALADDLINQVNTDPILSLGSRTGNKFYTARKVKNEVEATADQVGTVFELVVTDEGNDEALGRVQSEYPGLVITRVARVGAQSTYQFVQNEEDDVPDDFTNEGAITISDCGDCPSGTTAVDSGFVYRVKRQDAGTAGALTTLKSDYGISASNESGSRLSYEFGQSTYVIVSAIEINSPVGTDVLQSFGLTRDSCVVTDATTSSWGEAAVKNKFSKVYTITLHDNVCGVSRLAELQAAFPSLTIEEVAGSGDNEQCVHQFSTEVLSDWVDPDCPPGTPKWVAPDAFEGIAWVATAASNSSVAVGVVIESTYQDRAPVPEYAFDYWDYDSEPLYIQVSQHSQDYNDKPTMCTDEWPVTTLQEPAIPTGTGSEVRMLEKQFNAYRRQYRDDNPIVREYQNAILQANPDKSYDQYTLEFEFDYHQAWFTEKLTDTYRLEVYFPEGTGKQYEAAINAYVASAGIDLPPVIL